MNAEKPRCAAYNELLDLRCDREPGHAGAHVQDDPTAWRAWGFDPAGGSSTGTEGEATDG